MCADYVCLYVDNSNVFIEGKRIAETLIGEDGPSFRLHFRNFIDLATHERELREVVWGGSIPPPEDSVWKHLEGIGVKPELIPLSKRGE